MANRAKRIALSSKEKKVAQVINQLYQESKLREAERRQYRELERQENREYLRLIRRGLPKWVIQQPNALELISRVSGFKQSWLQPLRRYSWKEELQSDELAVHLPTFLFAHYPVPAFMERVFAEGDYLSMGWYIHLGRGKNIRKAPDLPFPMTKKMAHFFLESPDFNSVHKSLRYGQVLGYGGSEDLALAIIDSRMDYDPGRADFWAEVIQWMVNHEPIHGDYVKMIISYIQERKFRRTRLASETEGIQIHSVALDPEFSIKGRAYDKLLKSAIEWNWLKAQMGDHSRNTIAKEVGDLFYFTGGGKKPRVRYEIRPLLTAAEIIEEGRAMRHCVGTYAQEVGQNKTSIWSLTQTDTGSGKSQRLLTIEVLQDRTIEEVRGASNRLATAFERTLLMRWASQEELSWEQGEIRY